jgi:ABC-type glycerol-3-phosphate transport system permease component
MMVIAVVAIIPPFVVYLIAQNQVIETFVNSGLKG